MQKNSWLSYSDLAWTESIIANPDDCSDEVAFYGKLVKENAAIEVRSLLHLGCGAGIYDHHFKKHFQITGVDLSEEMLKIARASHPEVIYVHGDMRSIDLDERFDAVVIPDSIDYMTTLAELQSAIVTACRHLKPGGVLVIVAKIREEFTDNNFCYAGAKDGVEVTIFENNYVPAQNPSIYEATLIYLIRQQGELRIHTDCHRLGLFSQAEWLSLLQSAGLEVKQVRFGGVYEPFILGAGQYPMQIFIGVRRV